MNRPAKERKRNPLAPAAPLGMKTWALANQKGGTGKTTTAINLASALAVHGKRCLLIDLDPQAHATLGLGVSVEDGRSIASTFLAGAPLSGLVRTSPGGLHLIPSESSLGEFEEVAERTLEPERILRRALRELAGRYDWVLLDCPPRASGPLCANAIRAADTVCLVVEPGAFSMQGAVHAQRIFLDSARELGGTGSLRVLATLYDRDEPLSREFLIALHARFGGAMLDTVVRRDEHLREAAACGMPVHELAPGSPAARDFQALARELLRTSHGDPEELCLSRAHDAPYPSD